MGMRSRGCCRRLVAAGLVLHLVILWQAAALALVQTQRSNHDRIRHFFELVDHDKDGHIEKQEAVTFIGGSIQGSGFASEQEVQRAVERMIANVNRDENVTISMTEMELFLLQSSLATPVAEWVKHSVGLPQYEAVFRQHSLTVLDFLALVLDGGTLLETELGVHSKLHQQRLLRAMRLQLLGVGKAPSPPQALECSVLSAGRVQLAWTQSQEAGHPRLHKYVLERRLLGEGWTQVAESPDADTHVDAWVQPSGMQFRVAAWNLHGRSNFTYAPPCHPGPPTDPTALATVGTASTLGLLRRAAAALPWRPASAAATPPQARPAAGSATGPWGSLGGLLLLAFSLAARLVTPAAVVSMLRATSAALRRLVGGRPAAAAATAAPGADLQRLGTLPPTRGSVRLDGPSALPHVRVSGSSSSGAGAAAVGAAGAGLGAQSSAGGSPLWAGGGGSPMLSRRSTATMTGEDGVRAAGARSVSMREGAEVLGMRRVASSSAVDGTAGQAAASDSHKLCACPGCTVRVQGSGLRHLRSMLQSHVCWRCQRTYCLEHTAYSPHGPTGSCGPDSRCVCAHCFDTFSAHYRASLAASNTLAAARQRRSQRAARKLQLQQAAAAAGGEGGGGAGEGSRARLLWGRAHTKMAAVMRFKFAQAHGGHEGGGGPGAAGAGSADAPLS